jgi:heme/copper-type cytochrome/quinol oxidase subunit 2
MSARPSKDTQATGNPKEHKYEEQHKTGLKSSNIKRQVTMLQWMWIFRIFILIGVTIFTIGQISSLPDGNLAAYIWFAIGLLAS